LLRSADERTRDAIAIDLIDAFIAIQPVAAAVADDAIIALATVNLVRSVRGDGGVAHDVLIDVSLAVAEQSVIVTAAEDEVVARASRDVIHPCATGNDVVAIIGPDAIVAVARIDDVGAATVVDPVGAP
jgi:hypothetical protein